MDFFGMGMGEVLLILVVALIILGPGRLPEIARKLGQIVRTFRKASFDLTSQLGKELNTEEKDRSPQSTANSGDKTKESSDVDTTESSGSEMASPKD